MVVNNRKRGWASRFDPRAEYVSSLGFERFGRCACGSIEGMLIRDREPFVCCECRQLYVEKTMSERQMRQAAE
jgi:hypothetical protein